MSLSRFLSQNLGSLNISDQINITGHILTASNGNLLINGNSINENSNSVFDNLNVSNSISTSNLNVANYTSTSDLNVSNSISTSNLNVSNYTSTSDLNVSNSISTSNLYIYHPNSSSDQDPFGNSAINLVAQGDGGAVLNIDLTTYYTNTYPTARISLIDDGSFGSTFNIMTKPSGSPNNMLVSRLLIEPNHGYIGINNTNPQYHLDITGHTNISGNLSIGPESMLYIPNGGADIPSLISTNITTNNLLVTGNLNFNKTITYVTNSELSIDNGMSGTTFILNQTGNTNIYLPAPSTGLNFKFIQGNTQGNWAYIINSNLIGRINTNDTQGNIVIPAGYITDIDFSNTSITGDQLDIISDGTNYYYNGSSYSYNGFNFNQW